MMSSRNPQLLKSELYVLWQRFDKAMKSQAIEYILTCTVRNQDEQDALYEQGRTKPGTIVTWTRKSKHVTGEAFDIAVFKDGKISWASKDYEQVGLIGKGIGLDWGGDWHHRDVPHFQLRPDGAAVAGSVYVEGQK